MVCPKCGANNPENVKQCLRCGNYLTENNPVNQTMPQSEGEKQPAAVATQNVSQQGNTVPQQQPSPAVENKGNVNPVPMQQPATMPVNNPVLPGNSENRIANQTSNVPLAQNVEQAMNQNINSLYANTPVANKNSKEIDQKRAVSIYMGEKANKIQAGNNFIAAILGSVWFFYRKLYVHGIVVLLLEIISYALSRGLSLPIALFIVVRFFILFFAANIFYTNKSVSKVEKLQFNYDNSDMTKEEYIKILKKEGGTNIVSSLIGIVLLVGGIFAVYYIIPEKYLFEFETVKVKAKGWVQDGEDTIKYEDANGKCYFKEYPLTNGKTEEDFIREYEINEADVVLKKDEKYNSTYYGSYTAFAGNNKYKVLEVKIKEVPVAYLLLYGSKLEQFDTCEATGKSTILDNLIVTKENNYGKNN